MPNITIKKSDGTFASVPLDQLKKESAALSTPAPHPSEAPSQSSLPAKLSTPVLPAVRPRARVLASSSKLSSQDFTSPLEEKLDTAKFSSVPGKSFADSHVGSVLSSLSFTIPKDYENRLRTVVQLMIKQVRTDEQTKEVSGRPRTAGGLGLNEKQTEELLEICHEELKKMHPEYGVELPATITPFNAFKHGPTTSDAPKMSPLLSRQEKVSSILENAAPQRRPVMADVTVKPFAVGPIEELRTSTLTDIRRLAPTTKDAFARYGQKFVNIKNESVVLFFEARDAYHQGIIFEEYTSILLRALTERTTLENTVESIGSWKIEELQELIHMEKNLGL